MDIDAAVAEEIITPDRDRHNIWAFERCGSVSCVNTDLPTSP
jgi:hypothetical protein